MYRAILNEIQSLIEKGNGATEAELKALWNQLSDAITQTDSLEKQRDELLNECDRLRSVIDNEAERYVNFIEWKDFNTMTDKIKKDKMVYMITDIDAPLTWFTLDGLYEYWIKNVEK